MWLGNIFRDWKLHVITKGTFNFEPELAWNKHWIYL